ncbi:cation diffusion facilitator family transporter [Halanaerocella petrolearia]
MMNPEKRYQTNKKVTLITLLTNFILSVIKILIGVFFFSQAIIADGIHSISDVLSTATVWIAIRVSRKPADRDHPYGHGRAETIAAKLIGTILFLTGVLLVKDTLVKVWSGQIKKPGLVTIWIAILSVLIKEIMYQYTYRKGQQLNNKALIADAHHHRSDALSSIAALVGIIGARLGYPVLDPLAGLVVAVMILKMGFNIFRDAIDDLMDKVDIELYQKVYSLVVDQANRYNISDLKVRTYGSEIFIDLRIIVASDISVIEGHKIARQIEEKVSQQMVDVNEVLIHVDPKNAHSDKVYSRVESS